MAKRTDGDPSDSQPLWGFHTIYRDLQAISNDKKRGDAFEKVVLYYLRNDPVWRKTLGLDAHPGNARLWADASDWRWSDRDLGTDILVQDAQGRLWAVQAKCWRNDRPITKDEINSFLADSNRGTVFQRILVSTSPSLVSNARRTIRGQEGVSNLLCK